MIQLQILGIQSHQELTLFYMLAVLDLARINLAAYPKCQRALDSRANQAQETPLLIGLGRNNTLNYQRSLSARVCLLGLLTTPHQYKGGRQT
jgi:hypothetical protein